jgi:hypothetical protein
MLFPLKIFLRKNAVQHRSYDVTKPAPLSALPRDISRCKNINYTTKKSSNRYAWSGIFLCSVVIEQSKIAKNMTNKQKWYVVIYLNANNDVNLVDDVWFCC